MVATAAAYDEGPIAFRYPRGEGVGVDMFETPEPLEIGKGRILRTSPLNGGIDVAGGVVGIDARLRGGLFAAARRSRRLRRGRRPGLVSTRQ